MSSQPPLPKSRSVDMYPPTLGIRVRYTDGTMRNLMIDDGKPIQEIVSTTIVPLCSKRQVTAGGMQHYRTMTTLVLDEALMVGHEPQPPRRKRARADRFELPPPKPNDVVGFVNFREFCYAGIVTPSPQRPSIGLRVFSLEGAHYVTITHALFLIYHGGTNNTPLTTAALNYARQKLCSDKDSFSVESSNHMYDTLLLMKLLKAVNKNARQITLVRTDAIDDFISGTSGLGVDLDWTIRQVQK